MITVNLRPDLKRKRARRPLQGMLEGVRGLGSKIKDPVLLVAVVSWVGVLGWLGFVYPRHRRASSTRSSRSWSRARAENQRFKAFLAEKRHQETIRDSLVAQISVIRTRGRRPLRLAAPARRGDPGAAGLHLAGGPGPGPTPAAPPPGAPQAAAHRPSPTTPAKTSAAPAEVRRRASSR